MRKRFDIWTWAGFFTAAVLGTLGHFAYDWSGKSLPVGAFCAVNESTWACPTNWGMSPTESMQFVKDKMIPYYPLGVYKDVTAEEGAKA